MNAPSYIVKQYGKGSKGKWMVVDANDKELGIVVQRMPGKSDESLFDLMDQVQELYPTMKGTSCEILL